MSGSCRGAPQASRQRASPFLPEVHEELTKSWRAPYSARLRPSSSSALTSVDGAEDRGYEKLPPLDGSVAAHLCPPTAIGWKAKASHPSKPCRTTSALAGRAYTSAGQAASALHSMAILQVFQAKLLAQSDKSALDPATLTELRSATDLALRATKATAQAIGRSMASLVVLERHLWLTLTEIKDADKVPFLDAPISPTGLFGPSVEGFAERFTEAQKTSQAMRHFLPKRSSSATAPGRPKPAPPQQPARSAPSASAAAAAQPAKAEPRLPSRSTKRYPFPKRQGPRPKLALDPAPPPSS
ncbi:Platelet glycoprotein V [Labeo rohita]|uniref:Platelet glycoprotein V n=1 Tax=Labeo rohita TaxID=84645 RepID=A0ABQ8LVH1_LABRO|nr:Platelet glycoprotein V [Labeo rohita]